MKQKFLVLAYLVLAMFLLAGCLGGGGGSSGGGSILGGGIEVADIGEIAGGINPEPATALLLGGGLAAYAFLVNKRKKK